LAMVHGPMPSDFRAQRALLQFEVLVGG